jgi:hypothetical protein
LTELDTNQASRDLLDLQYMKMLLNTPETKNDVSINYKYGTVLLRGLMVGMFVAGHN